MSWPLIQVVDLVASDVDGRSAEASALLRRSLARAVRDVPAACGGLPPATAKVRRVAIRAGSEPIGIHRLDRLEAAFVTWAAATRGDSPVAGAVAEVRRCRAVEDTFRVGYQLWWDHAPYGRRWWMVLVFENGTDRTHLLGLTGSLWATAVVGRTQWRTDGRGGEEFRWGGSSADFVEAPPGRSTRLVGVSGVPEVHTTSEGVVYRVRPQVFYPGGGGCSLPVPRLN